MIMSPTVDESGFLVTHLSPFGSLRRHDITPFATPISCRSVKEATTAGTVCPPTPYSRPPRRLIHSPVR
jgi:hypothetical protein